MELVEVGAVVRGAVCRGGFVGIVLVDNAVFVAGAPGRCVAHRKSPLFGGVRAPEPAAQAGSGVLAARTRRGSGGRHHVYLCERAMARAHLMSVQGKWSAGCFPPFLFGDFFGWLQ